MGVLSTIGARRAFARCFWLRSRLFGPREPRGAVMLIRRDKLNMQVTFITLSGGRSTTTRPVRRSGHLAYAAGQMGRAALALLATTFLSCKAGAPGASGPPAPAAAGGLRFAVTIAAGLVPSPQTGRLLLLIAPAGTKEEPRTLVSDTDDSAQVFGVDVEGWAAGQVRPVGTEAVGYPLGSIAELPAGEYVVQALLHRYETFRRSDGHTVS